MKKIVEYKLKKRKDKVRRRVNERDGREEKGEEQGDMTNKM